MAKQGSMKKWMISATLGGVVLIIGAFVLGRYALPFTGLPALPAPELAEGQRGALGIDKNINEATIDQYLGRSDAMYRDMRMLSDPGNYAAIGGDAMLSGFVKGFEVVPYPLIANVSGLPEAVGETYAGPTLFTIRDDGSVVANYTESMAILEALFPRDKVIFLMCGGGGYSGMMKDLLVKLGWDASKIYDVGGYWFYEGANKVEVKRELADGRVVYDFYKVPYHEIVFDGLTPVTGVTGGDTSESVDGASGEVVASVVQIGAAQYDAMVKRGESFLLLVDQEGCTTGEKLGGFLARFVREDARGSGGIYYRMMFDEVKKSGLSGKVKFYPSVVVVARGEVKGWLRADADEDAGAYNNYEDFARWVREK